MSDLAVGGNLAIVDLQKMPASDLAKAKDIAKSITVGDSNAIIQFGVGAQKNISEFSDSMLKQVRSKDTGEVGQALTDLVFKIKDLNVNEFTNSKVGGFLSGLFNKVERFFAKYEKVGSQIDKILEQLNSSRMMMLRDITMLDLLYQKNIEYLNNLDIFIAAGQIKIEELKNVELPKLQVQAQTSGDPMDAQKLNDFTQFINRFEKKLYDLKLSRMIAIQTAPQVRLIQNNDQALVEKIQSSIMTTIPLWKNQIVIAISLFRQKQALGVQKAVTDETNNLLLRNSEMLKQGSIEVAKENERGIVEIETLQKTNADLISTLEETLKIQEEGKQKRAQAEQTLTQLEAELKAKLSTVRG